MVTKAVTSIQQLLMGEVKGDGRKQSQHPSSIGQVVLK
jgi:hypothetical protein